MVCKYHRQMNRPTTQDRVRILTVLSEGMGINAACRVTGASKNTVLKLLADVGTASNWQAESHKPRKPALSGLFFVGPSPYLNVVLTTK